MEEIGIIFQGFTPHVALLLAITVLLLVISALVSGSEVAFFSLTPREKQDMREKGMLIDATFGRRTRAVIITDSDHVILSAIQAETVANRLDNNDSSIDDEEEEND